MIFFTFSMDGKKFFCRECINRVCEASGIKSSDKKRRPDQHVCHMISSVPSMEKAGANVQLTITSLWLKLSDLDSGRVNVFLMLSKI